MTVQDELLEMLETVANALGDELRERLVFVGGCTTALFITDPVTLDDVRATYDVDLIVDLAGYAEWAQLQEQLREKGFMESPEDGVICRMRLGELKVDFMPDDPDILGFANRWYAGGIDTADVYYLPSGMEIKCLTAPYFLATKLEAYLGRGGNDPYSSKDLEDILIVVDGREELISEVLDADLDVREFIVEQTRELIKHPDFEGFVRGNIRTEGRAEIVLASFDALTIENDDD